MIGRTVGGYIVVEKIGAGGMAMVYKAYDRGFDRFVALKVLPQLLMEDPQFRERFDREAKAIAMLEHIHILPVYAVGEEDGIAYLAMRYIETGTLATLLASRTLPLPLDEASRLLGQMAEALDYAHRRGVLHRDMKPANVLLDADRNAYLADFGLAKILSTGDGLTGQAVIGTPMYMSPEQVLGEEEITPASDQYALGIVLFEMVTGQTPFFSQSTMKLLMMHLNDPVPSPHSLRAELPELAEAVILRALAKQPQERYPDCATLAEAFDQALAGKGLHRLSGASVPGELRSRIDSALARVQLDSKRPRPSREDGPQYTPLRGPVKGEQEDESESNG